MSQINIIKIGGNVLDNEQVLKAFVKDFSQLQGNHILVHGGGKSASRLSERMGVQPTMIEGRRVTDAATLEVVTMVYGGLINKNLVALLQAEGCNAIGLTGADANIIPAEKRVHPTIDFGFVGDISPGQINNDAVLALLNAGLTPVFCALTHDGKGQLFNTNADTIAAELAKSLSRENEVTLTYCFEKKGVLMDVNDEDSLISSMDLSDYERLKAEHIIHEGMIPKLHNAFEALKDGVAAVQIKHAQHLSDDVGTALKIN